MSADHLNNSSNNKSIRRFAHLSRQGSIRSKFVPGNCNWLDLPVPTQKYRCTGLSCTPGILFPGQGITWHLVHRDTLHGVDCPPGLSCRQGSIRSKFMPGNCNWLYLPVPTQKYRCTGLSCPPGILSPWTRYQVASCHRGKVSPPANPIHLSFNIIWWVNSTHPHH